MTRRIALALTALTGFSGLVYEVAWQKYLATLLGSHSEATAAVLAIFLGGLAVGYSVFGAITARMIDRAATAGTKPRLGRAYGLVEASIGLYALAFPYLFAAAHEISYRLPITSGAVSFAFDVSLAAVLIGPPTVLMGGTIPMLTQALSRSLEDATRLHALVYGFNTAGAFAGALAGGLWLVPTLGLVWSLAAMGLVNLVAGAFFLLGARSIESGAPAPTATPPDDQPAVPQFGTFLAVALLVGFSMMVLQTVLIRIGGLALGASHFTFAMVVAAFVLCIAIGSFVVSALTRIPPWTIAATQWLLVGVLLVLYTQIEDAPYWAHRLRTNFGTEPNEFYTYSLASFAGMLVVLAIPIVLSGAALPLLFHHLRTQVGDLGAMAGRLYSLNTAGSLIGSLLGGYVLLYWLDLHAVFRIGVAGLVVAATLLSWQLLGRLRGPVATALGSLAALCLILLPPWDPDRLGSGLFRNRTPIQGTYEGADELFAARSSSTEFYTDDPTASIAVKAIEYRGKKRFSLITNGKPDGSPYFDRRNMALIALIPSLLAEKTERAFVIGYGSGLTVGELNSLADMKEVVVAEISPGVMEAAAYFEADNLNALADPKTSILNSDAYRALLRSEGRFDVVSSMPSNPWVTGVEMLYSQEFLRAARDKLAPGGVYAQWLHSYETDQTILELVLRTYASVFEGVAVWYTQQNDLVLLGFRTAKPLPMKRLIQRANRKDFREALQRSKINGLTALLAHELLPLGVVSSATTKGAVHSLYHPVLSHKAAIAFFRGDSADLPRFTSAAAAAVSGQNSLLRRYSAQHGGFSGPLRRDAVRETCRDREQECAVMIAQWMREVPDSPALKNILRLTRRDPQRREELEEERLLEIAELYGGSRPPPHGRDPVERATRATDLFASAFHHAVPFDRAVLTELWSQCEEELGPAACAQGRESRAGSIPVGDSP